MKILPVNNTSPNFNGKIITKGPWTDYLKEGFERNPDIIKLASGKKDIIGELSHKKAKRSVHHSQGEDIYKLKLKAVPSEMGILDKIKYILGITPEVPVRRDYHKGRCLDYLMK